MDYLTATRNIIGLEEVTGLFKEFEKRKVTAMLLSGAALLAEAYADISRRPMADIDLLVRPEDISKIAEVLKKSGYEQIIPCGELNYIKNKSVALDIHCEIWYLDKTEFNKLWLNARSVDFGDTKALVMAPEDMLIYAAADAAVHHGHIKDVAISDLNQIIKTYRQEIRWENVINKAKKYNLGVPVFYAFLYAQKYGPPLFPREVLEALKPAASQFLESRLYQLILNNKPIPEIGHFLRPIARRGIKNKLGFLLKFFFPSEEFLTRRYQTPGQGFPSLFYLIRPFMHFWRAIKIMAQLLQLAIR